MRMYDIIKNKRDGNELTGEEIRWFIEGYVKGEILDYQAAALCMAIYFRGMNVREITDLTFAVRDSGDKLDFSGVHGIRADKHSTGGVGDKTSLVVAPIVASYGVKVAKMSGRGLGHTGGTIDKLESIDGFRTDLTEEEFLRVVNEVGVAIVGQNAELAPADKKLYALRDVTATVDSMPLMVSSIMGKKLAADDDCIVLDVKTGSGAFVKTIEESKELARIMVEIGKRAGKKTLALITDMDIPLGRAVGNSLEVIEAIETLNGNGPEDFKHVCIELAAHMLYLTDKGSIEECRVLAQNAISSGSALKVFTEMVKAQGGNPELVSDTKKFRKATYKKAVVAKEDGYISHMDTEGYGVASLLLGAGRNAIGEAINYASGIIICKKTGDKVASGDVLAYMFTDEEHRFDGAERKILESVRITKEKPEMRPLILSVVE